jgi:hypothetical protein
MNKRLTILICAALLAVAAVAVIPAGEQPLEIRVTVMPVSKTRPVPLRSDEPFYCAAAVTQADTHHEVGKIEYHVARGGSRSKGVTTGAYRIEFATRLDAREARAMTEVTVWRDGQLLARQTSDVGL